jgi:MFS family permease
VLFAKITPKHIEATVFSFFTGIFNLSAMVISPNIGVLINKLFIGVTTANLENYYKLQMIQLVLSVIPLFLLFLIPLKSEIKELQKKEADAKN